MLNPAGGWYGSIDCNPARILDPEGYSPCPVERLHVALDELWAAVSKVCDPSCSLAEAKVTRLDYAVDFFGVARPGFYLLGLRPLHRSHGRRNVLYTDSRSGLPSALYLGGKRDKVVLYDRHIKADPPVPGGTMRLEVRAYRAWLKRYSGIRNYADITEDRVEELAENRFNWSMAGREVVDLETAVKRVVRAELSYHDRVNLLDHLISLAEGDASARCDRTRTKYERMAERLGIVLSPEALQDSILLGSGRLDFVRGVEVRTGPHPDDCPITWTRGRTKYVCRRCAYVRIDRQTRCRGQA